MLRQVLQEGGDEKSGLHSNPDYAYLVHLCSLCTQPHSTGVACTWIAVYEDMSP